MDVMGTSPHSDISRLKASSVMIEQLFENKTEQNCPAPHELPNAPDASGYFSHINDCSVCRYGSRGLCETGEALLDLAAGIENVRS